MRRIILSKPFISVFLQQFLVFCSLNVLAVIPDHLAAIGASKTYIGLYMNVGSLVLVLLVVPLSHFTDLIGRKRLLLATFAIGLASNAFMFAFSRDLAWLLALRFSNALMFCAAFTILPAEVMGMMPRERRMTGMAVFGVGGILSNPVSAKIGEIILEGPGPEWLFAAAGLFLAAALALAAGFKYHVPKKTEKRSGFFALLRRKALWNGLSLAFMMGGAFSVYSSFLANLSRERLGMVQISPFYAAFAATAIFIRLFGVRYLEKVPGGPLAAVCIGLNATALALTSMMSSAWMLVPFGLIYGAGNGILYPLVSTMIVNSGSDEDRLGLNNLFSSMNTLGNIVLAVVMGAAADLMGTAPVFLLTAALLALVIPAAWRGKKA